MPTNDDTCAPSGNNYPSDCDLTQALREKAMNRKAITERSYAWRSCQERAGKIKLLLLDVDGVLTDGTIVYTDDGNEIKAFHTRDGLGLRLLREAGIETGLITARESKAVTRRAQDLKLTHVYQKAGNKLEIYEKLLTDLKLKPEEVAYMGDDWLDLPLLVRVGFAATVADGNREVKQRVHYITEKSGGRGAVREVCDLILEAKGVQEAMLENYINKGANQ